MKIRKLFQEIISKNIDNMGDYYWIEVGNACFDNTQQAYLLEITAKLTHRSLVIRDSRPLFPPIAGRITHKILSLGEGGCPKWVGEAWTDYQEEDLNIELFDKPCGLLVVSKINDPSEFSAV